MGYGWIASPHTVTGDSGGIGDAGLSGGDGGDGRDGGDGGGKSGGSSVLPTSGTDSASGVSYTYP